jgi:hypothetical protein
MAGSRRRGLPMLRIDEASDSPRNPGANDAGRNAHFSGRVAAALISDEALTPLAELPAIARINALGAKLPEAGS